MAAYCIPTVHEDVHEVILLLPALYLLQLVLYLVQPIIQPRLISLEVLNCRQFLLPTLQPGRILKALLHFLKQKMQVAELFLGPIPLTDQLPNPLILLPPLLLILLEVSIEIQHEVKHKLLIIFMHLLLLPIIFRSIDIQEEILWLISDVHLLLEGLTVDLNGEVELFIECVLKGSESRVQDDASEVAYYWLLFLQLGLLVVFYLSAVEELLDEAFFRVENGIESGLILALVYEGGPGGKGILVFLEELLAEGQTFTESLDDHNIDLRKVLLLPVRQFLAHRIHQILQDLRRIEILLRRQRHNSKKVLQLPQQLILILHPLQLGLIISKQLSDVLQGFCRQQDFFEFIHEEVALDEGVQIAAVGNIEQADWIIELPELVFGVQRVELVASRVEGLIIGVLYLRQRRQERSKSTFLRRRLLHEVILLFFRRNRRRRTDLRCDSKRIKDVHLLADRVIISPSHLLLTIPHLHVKLQGPRIQRRNHLAIIFNIKSD